MTYDHKAKLEQVARELWDLLEGARPYFGPTKDLPVKAIVEVLAAQRVAVLEEVAQCLDDNKVVSQHIGPLWNAGWTSAAQSFARRFRQQSQEQRA